MSGGSCRRSRTRTLLSLPHPFLHKAKKRNPDITTYGLPWAYPGWVGGPEQSGSPFAHPELTSNYILKWLEGARKVYSVEIDYIGIWNERASNATYAKTLRKTLDDAGDTLFLRVD
jgi:galactosylceramidase